MTLDGATLGEVFDVTIPTIDPKLSGDFATLMKWCDELKRLKVKANADTPTDAAIAKSLEQRVLDYAELSICSSRKNIINEKDDYYR